MSNYNNGHGSGYPPQGNPPPYGQGEAASYYASAGAQQHQQHPQQGQPGYGQPPQHQQHQQDGPDGERGVLGALGGGVAGAVGGNKIGGKVGHSKLSTVLGAVAGAVAGHKLQDGVSDWKDNRDEEKEKKKREEEEKKKREEDDKRREEEDRKRRDREQEQKHQQQHQSYVVPPGARAHDSNNNTRSLNYAGNFSSSSRDIRLDAHGDFTLHASCKRLDGSYQHSSISLNKLLSNDQGSFRWASSSSSSNRQNNTCNPTSVTVQPGDTLRNIAARVGCSFEEIARHNGLQNPDLIHPGQVLQLPNAGNNNNSGNSSGGVGNFGASARDVRLADGGRRLEGELLRGDGRWAGSSIVLDERIGNDNGTLVLV